MIQTKVEQKLLPDLRFPEFKKDWEERKLSEVAKITTGSTPSTSNKEFYNGDYPFVTPGDLNDGRYVTKTETTLTKLGFDQGRKVRKGSTLFVSIGSTIGKVGQTVSEVITNQQINTLESNENNHDDFIYDLLFKYGPKIKLLAGNQAVPLLNKSDFSKLSFFFPFYEEQQKIASFLTAVDKRIQLLEEKKKNLERFKKGAMQQIFSQEIRFKDEHGNDFPDWEEKKLGEVLTIGSGRDYKHLDDGNIPVYGTGGYMLSVNDYLFDGESVCIGRKGTIDKPMFLTGKFWTVDTLFYTHAYNGVIPFFIFLLFQQLNWKRYNEASGVPSLSKSTIEKISVMIPSDKEEQQKIATFLSAIDKAIEKVGKQVEETQQFKKGLLQKMFV